MSDIEKFNTQLLGFLKKSPTPFHAVKEMEILLREKNYTLLTEAEPWKLQNGKGYFVKRNNSSLVAFRLGTQSPFETGFRMAGSHTDSPNLKIKPNAEMKSHGFLQLGVEIYGGALLAPWFDRDLSLAGRVTYLSHAGHLRSELIDFERAIAVIPSLAIHLNRDVNESRKINKQTEMPPILCQLEGGTFELKSVLKQELERVGVTDCQKIMDYELSLYDVQDPSIIGLKGEFIAAARLDNLLSCFIDLKSMLEGDETATNVFVANDHEEVGSSSTSGADGTFLSTVLKRICETTESFSRAIDRSIFISTDNAHGVHPNYTDKHDHLHGPLINKGPVLKVNANQRYATNSETASAFIRACEKAEVPHQKFVTRADMACGSTIGPITASVLGVKTVDVGVPTFAMHSIRELAGVKDPFYLFRALKEFYNSKIEV